MMRSPSWEWVLLPAEAVPLTCWYPAAGPVAPADPSRRSDRSALWDPRALRPGLTGVTLLAGGPLRTGLTRGALSALRPCAPAAPV